MQPYNFLIQCRKYSAPPLEYNSLTQKLLLPFDPHNQKKQKLPQYLILPKENRAIEQE